LSPSGSFNCRQPRDLIVAEQAFLKVNGYRLEFDDSEAFSFLSSLYQAGTMRFAEIDSWLRGHTRLDQPT
jgi:prophage maintenance system killer protein